jgi:hypothetical protein
MTLQAAVNFKEYFRCFVVGQSEVRIMTYDPRQPYEHRYVSAPPVCDPQLLQRVEQDALTLCRALGYDLNTVEFGIENGIPYAIDFMNPVPDADLYSVGEASFHWIVDAMARLAVKKAQSPPSIEIVPQSQTHWSTFLSGAPATAPRQKTARLAIPKKAIAKPKGSAP